MIRVRASRYRPLLILLAVVALQSFAGESIRFRDRSAADVLRNYEQLGLAFIYSSDVLDSGRRFTDEPAAGPSLARLRKGLQQLGVTLRVADHNRRWLIVPLPRRPARAPRAPRDPDRAPPLASVRLIEEVVVVASHYALQNELASANQFDALQLEALPELGDDALRRVNHIPGVASLGLSAQGHVRGGDADETLILLDGVELVAPYHLRNFNSVFSVIHPGTVDHIDVYTGGFPVRFGGRSSAVLDIGTRANLPESGAELQLSPFTSAATAYGGSTAAVDDERGDGDDSAGSWQWLITARRSNLTALADRVNASIGSPDYYDAFAEGRWQQGGRSLAVGGLLYDDDVRLHEVNSDGIGAVDRTNDRSRYGWLRATDSGEGWSTQALLHVADVRHRRRGTVNDPDVDESIGAVDDFMYFRRLSLEQSLHWQHDANWQFDSGYQLRTDKARYRYRGEADRGALAVVLGVPTHFQRDLAPRLERVAAALYGSAQWQVSDALRAELGMRVEHERDANGGPDATQLSPRLGVRYDLSQTTSLRATLGRFRQPHALYELQTADNETNLQQAQVADHVIVGLDKRSADGRVHLRAEAFVKQIAHPKRRYENLFNAPLLVPELNPDRVQVVSERARSRGLEVQLAVQPTPGFGASLSYSRAVSEERVRGSWAPRAWDQKHSVQAGLLWTPQRWTFSAGLTWHSGWRITRLPAALPGVEEYPYRRNADNLSDYFTVDVRASRLWAGSHQSFLLYAEVTNFTNRHNIGAVTYQFFDEDGARPLILEREHERLLPIVPSVGFVWKFF